ncbi:DUF1554 domain-containing protein [Leptospira sp. 201903070]|uniref:DUF1554 domain-containing protein n=1 Tax=Leptospira ainlahdjerensis TaxID=2810033 RepID=A0ABS2U6F5_9LEPT|nr:DUF1554 domain-containing protein [Leptospira ainlahdjerensis]MBM9575947.1 DUF1554 domain-containing protein [Leptospira ainlahdjerensis]
MRKFYFVFLLLPFFVFSCTVWPVMTTVAKSESKDSDQSSSFLLLLSGGSVIANEGVISNATNPGVAPCSTTGSGCALFLSTASPSGGNFGGVAGADARCASDAATRNAPGVSSGSTYKALIMVENGTRNLTTNWILYPNTSYYSIENSNLRIGVTNGNAELPATFENSVSGGSIVVYTGISKGPPWTPYTNNTCSSWTVGTGAPNYGLVADTTIAAGYIDNGGSYACDYSLSFYCVQR